MDKNLYKKEELDSKENKVIEFQTLYLGSYPTRTAEEIELERLCVDYHYNCECFDSQFKNKKLPYELFFSLSCQNAKKERKLLDKKAEKLGFSRKEILEQIRGTARNWKKLYEYYKKL